ncbi:MAG: LysM peptidoglycan-binding domain-containing protein [Planctomycetota bacterium]
MVIQREVKLALGLLVILLLLAAALFVSRDSGKKPTVDSDADSMASAGTESTDDASTTGDSIELVDVTGTGTPTTTDSTWPATPAAGATTPVTPTPGSAWATPSAAPTSGSAWATPSVTPTPGTPSAYSPTTPSAYSPTTPSAYSPTTPSAYSPTTPSAYSPTTPSAYSPTTPSAYSPTTPSAYSPTTPSAYSPTTPSAYSPTTPSAYRPTTPSAYSPMTPSPYSPATSSYGMPPAPAAPAAPTMGGGKDYTIRKGDTYATIAKEEYGNSNWWKIIADANATVPETEMMPGTKIFIPPHERKGSAAATVSTATGAGTTHKVRSGDTLGKIAKQYYGKESRWKEIMSANPKIKDEYDLKIGAELVIPGVEPVAAASDFGPPSYNSGVPTLDGFGAPVPAGSSQNTYTVRKGDTLWAIAEAQLGSGDKYKTILAANPGLTANDLKVGQKITIPGQGGGSYSGETVSSGDSYSYTVKEGEWLGDIALNQLGKAHRWREIAAINPGMNPNKIKVGQKIKIPTGSSSSTSSTAGGVPALGSTGYGTTSLGQPAGDIDYTVRSGDSLQSISKQFFGTYSRWKDILRANPHIKNEYSLFVGAKLKIPMGSGNAAPAPIPAAPTPYGTTPYGTTGGTPYGSTGTGYGTTGGTGYGATGTGTGYGTATGYGTTAPATGAPRSTTPGTTGYGTTAPAATGTTTWPATTTTPAAGTGYGATTPATGAPRSTTPATTGYGTTAPAATGTSTWPATTTTPATGASTWPPATTVPAARPGAEPPVSRTPVAPAGAPAGTR